MSGAPWLIVQTIRLAGERMTTWLGKLGELQFETYYPMIRELKRVPRRELSHAQRTSGVDLMRPRVVPFLPGRVFVRERGGNMRLLDMPGVTGFLCVAGEPARISDTLIERLRVREREGDGAIPGATPAEFIFRRGDQVRVVNGPFAAFDGIVEAPPDVPLERIDAETRLRLTIDIFGRATVVHCAVADVRKI